MESTSSFVVPAGFQEFHKSCRRKTASSTSLKCMRASSSEKEQVVFCIVKMRESVFKRATDFDIVQILQFDVKVVNLCLRSNKQ